MTSNRTLTYNELIGIETYKKRLSYLIQNGRVFEKTFGSLRHLNQEFYTSREWKRARRIVLLRDGFHDLAIDGMEIAGTMYVHHMNPITPELLVHNPEKALDPNYLITASRRTHHLIHYGRMDQVDFGLRVRSSGDTKLW